MSEQTILSPAQARSLSREIGHDTGQPLGVAFGGGSVRYGVAERDHVEALQFPNSVGVYEKMGADSAVTAVMRAVTLPIRSAKRAIDGTGCRPEVVDLVASDLGLPILGADATGVDAGQGSALAVRSKDRFIFADHLRLALLSLKFGCMFFEQNVRVEQVITPAGVTQRVRLRKLAPRFPGTLSGIETAEDGGLVGVRQPPLSVAGGGWTTSQPAGYAGPALPSTTDDLIPVTRLVAYSHEREGAAWQGRSLLRHAYRPWFLKEQAWRDRATMMNRTSMGIAEYQGAPGESDSQLAKGGLLAQAARSGEMAGVAVPNGASLRFRGVEGSLPDHSAYIADLNSEIADGVLAQFMKLGDSATGSRALGESFIDFFTLGLRSIDDWFTATFNEHVIEDLVDWNWGEDEPAPRLVTVDRIGSDDAVMAQSIIGLLQAGGLTYDTGLEGFLRKALTLPALDPSTARLPAAVAASRHPFADGDGGHVHAAAEDTGPSRPLTHVEAASGLDAANMDATWRAALAALLADWRAVRSDQIDALLDQITGLLEAGDVAALGTLTAAAGAGVPALTAALTRMAADAARAAAAEAASQGITVAAVNVADLAEGLTARAIAVDALIASGLANAASRQALLRIGAGVATAAVIAGIREHLEGLSEAFLEEQLGGALTAAQNTARVATFRPIGDDDVTFYASELLDTATCHNCAAIDNTQYATLAEAEADYPSGGFRDCQGGARCRGTVVMTRNEAAPTT